MPTEEELRANPRPWMTDGAIEFMERSLRPTDKVIEFGGGWSTLWWAARAAWVHTVEASPIWIRTIIQEMAARPELLTRWSARFVASEWHTHYKNPKPFWRNKLPYLNDQNVQKMEAAYLVIDFPADVFVIDGSLRPQCVQLVHEHIESGQSKCRMIVVDNMESMVRHTAGKFPEFKQYDFHEYDMEKIPAHQNGRWCTSVWIRD